MKHIKNFQIFEAFDSKVLSKTLGYIKDSNDKEKFFKQITRVCNQIDYPISQLSDDVFEYLSFKNALKKAAMTGDEPCEATSRSEFPDYAVEGSTCQGGKLKRMWGSRQREVVCPVCNGTGVKPKRSEMKLLKFWFTTEGKYVATTMVDGILRGNTKVPAGKISFDTSDYETGQRVNNLRDLNGGEMVKVTINNTTTIAYIIKQGTSYYAIQNRHSGSSPSGTSWQSIARYSWSLGGGEYRNMFIALPKQKGEGIKEEADPYSWNVACNFSYSGVSVSSSDVRDLIKDAHFAIVFDFGKLKKSEFKTKSEIESSREEAKKGSKLDPSQSDEEIRKRNIERYVNTLSQKLDITKDISNCNRLITRSLGGKRGALFIVYSTDVYSRFTSVISQYLQLLKEDDDSTKLRIVENIADRSEELFRAAMKKSSITSSIVKNIKTMLKSQDKDEVYIKIFDTLDEISEAIYDNLNSCQVDSIEDFEIVAQKVSSMRNILKADRYGCSRFFNYVIDYISSERESRAYSYLVDRYYIEPEETLEALQRVKTLMSKI